MGRTIPSFRIASVIEKVSTTENDQQVNRKNIEQLKEGKVKVSLRPIPVVWFSPRSSTSNQS